MNDLLVACLAATNALLAEHGVYIKQPVIMPDDDNDNNSNSHEGE